MSTVLILRNARLSFDKNLFVPTDKKNGRSGKRNCNLICSADTEIFVFDAGKKTPITRADLQKKVIDEALKKKFGGKVPAKYENWAFRENTNSVSATTGERHKGYEDDDGYYLSPSRIEDQGLPAFARKDGSPIKVLEAAGYEEALRSFYGGCYVTAKVVIGAFEAKEDNMIKRGVTAYLEALQFLRAGERFGGGEANTSGFEDEEKEGEMAEDFDV